MVKPLSYMVEEHVPLSDPDNYPIYVVNEFPDLDGTLWNLKTLLSSKVSFKVDILEDEARAIPELNHYFISWNIYIVPKISETATKKEAKMLRNLTQTDLVVQYNMKQLNVNGEMSGYFNESWSEAEICKSQLDPRELFNSP